MVIDTHVHLFAADTQAYPYHVDAPYRPSSPATLEAGMIISIDIPLFNTPWGGLRIENGYLITPAGAEALHGTPMVLRR